MMLVEQSLPFLVVDDQRTTLRILEGLLRRLGFPGIDEATDGALALAMMREKRYGLVISTPGCGRCTGSSSCAECGPSRPSARSHSS